MSVCDVERFIQVRDGTTGLDFPAITYDVQSQVKDCFVSVSISDYLILKHVKSCLNNEHDVFIRNSYKR